jgi:hypothetical protein
MTMLASKMDLWNDEAAMMSPMDDHRGKICLLVGARSLRAVQVDFGTFPVPHILDVLPVCETKIPRP